MSGEGGGGVGRVVGEWGGWWVSGEGGGGVGRVVGEWGGWWVSGEGGRVSGEGGTGVFIALTCCHSSWRTNVIRSTTF